METMKSYQKDKGHKVDMWVTFLFEDKKKYLLAYLSITLLIKLISTFNMENCSRNVMNYTIVLSKTKGNIFYS